MSIQHAIATILLILGVMELVDSVRTLLNPSPDIERDTALSKKLFSPYTRYWIGRYHSGFNGLTAGVGLIVLAAILYFGQWI